MRLHQTYLTSKETIDRVKRQHTEWEKTFTNSVSDERLIITIYKELLKLTGGNGNPLQCSCLENPRDGGAWWAAVCGVAQSRT